MIPFSKLIDVNIPGETPKEKYENLSAMKRFLQIVAFPHRGTKEEDMDAYQLAEMIQGKFSAEDLSERGVED